MQKGGSDPLSLFGPQAGRKEGVAPALLTCSPAYDPWGLKLELHCLIGALENEGRKTVRKPVRKTDCDTVFRSFGLYRCRIWQ
jgi:hypothetical protein